MATADYGPNGARLALMANNRNTGDEGGTSQIGKSLFLDGKIVATGDVTISGRFQGEIEMPSNRLIVAHEGEVHANIKAGEIEVRGKVVGDVLSTHSAALTASANVAGKLETQELRVEEGAVFRGQVDIIT